jgi:hypothetical protein
LQCWGWNSGLMHARQVLYHWAAPPVSALKNLNSYGKSHRGHLKSLTRELQNLLEVILIQVLN